MTTYWLLGEKEQDNPEQATPPQVIVGVQDDQNVERHELEIAPTTATCITEVPNAHLPSETGSKASETSKKAHFIEHLSETEAANRDSNNRSSNTNNPSNSLLSDSSSSQKCQPSTHIFSNPMTSIVIISDEDTGPIKPQLTMSSTSCQQPTSSLG